MGRSPLGKSGQSMKELSNIEMRTIMEAASSERRNVEFKQGFTWGDQSGEWLQECFIRAVLGCTNTPSGGTIIVGIKEADGQPPKIEGLTPAQVQSFTSSDLLKDQIDAFSSTPISFEIAYGQYEQRTLIIVTVSQFDDLPAICRKSGKHSKLEQGAIYSRRRKGAPATIKVTELEMAEILDMAVDKQIARLRKRGLLSHDHLPSQPTAEARFAEQVKDWDEI